MKLKLSLSQTAHFTLATLLLTPSLRAAADSVDSAFAATAGQLYETAADTFGSVASLYVLADGKILVGSNEMPVEEAAPPRQVSLIRFNDDGTVASDYFADTDAFGSGTGIYYDAQGWPEVMALGRQSDGKLVIGGVMQGMRDGSNSKASVSVLRINADDTADSTFATQGTTPWPTGGLNYVEDLIIDPDDKILLAGGFGGIRQMDNSIVTRYGLARLNADGSLDSGFHLEPTEFGVPSGASLVRAIIRQVVREASGKYYIAGSFEWNGGTAPVLARLYPNGRRDMGFVPVADVTIEWTAVYLEPDGNVTALGLVPSAPSAMMRFQPDGSVDPSFNYPRSLGTIFARPLQADAQGRYLVHGGSSLWRILADGSVDPNFAATASWDLVARAGAGFNTSWVADDGRIYAGGFFDTVNGVNTAKIVRFEGDAVADGYQWQVRNVVIAEDGGSLHIGVRRFGGSAAGTVQYATQNGTALAGSDYTATSGSLSWAQGETGLKFITVPLLDNGATDGARSFTLTLSNPTAGSIVDGAVATITLQDDEALASIIAQPASGAIFSGVNTTLRVRVTSPTAVSFQWQVDTGGGYQNIPGAISAHYTIVNAQQGIADGTYRVVVTNAAGSLNSAGAVITVVDPPGTLDASFSLGGSGFNNGDARDSVLLEDGRIVVVGDFSQFNGSALSAPYVIRLTADGAIDPLWVPGVGAGADNVIRHVAVHPATSPHAGKIVVAGNFRNYNGTAVPRLARLNADGSFDSSWIPSASVNFNDFAVGVEVMADGAVVVGYSSGGIRKYNPDGSLAFNYARPTGFLNILALQADGKVLAVYRDSNPTRHLLYRYLDDGSYDPAFNPEGTSSNGPIAIDVAADGSIYLAGGFLQFGGSTSNRLVRLYADGRRDTSFVPQILNSLTGLRVLADGSLLLAGGTGNTVDGEPVQALFRLLADGSVDGSFFAATGAQLSLMVDASGRYYGLDGTQLRRFLPDFGAFSFAQASSTVAEFDGSAVIEVQRLLGARGAVSVQWEITGGTAVAGTHYTGASSGTLTWSDGDSSAKSIAFTLIDNPGAAADQTLNLRLYNPSDLTRLGTAAQATLTILDGDSPPRITAQPSSLTRAENLEAHFAVTALSPLALSYQWYFAGNPILGATAASYTIGSVSFADAGDYRVEVSNSNGSTFSSTVQLSVLPSPTAVDGDWSNPVSFNAGVTAVLPLGAGRALVGGSFSSPRSRLALINADGSLDSNFTSQLSTTNGHYVASMVRQPDGKILIAGRFTQIGGVAATNLVRLNADYSVDTDFLTLLNGAPDFTVKAVALQPDGKILIGGDFTQVGGAAGTRGIARLNANGSIDHSFASRLANTQGIDVIRVLGNGQILIGGSFSNYQGADRMARLQPDGERDLTFFSNHFNSTVRSILVMENGDYLVGGNFTTTSRPRLARVSATGVLDSSYLSGITINNNVTALVAQANGRIVVGGAFTTFGAAASGFMRLEADGSLDPTLSLGSGFNNGVDAVALDADGAIWVAGLFTTYQGVAAGRIVRLAGDAVPLAIEQQPTAAAAVLGSALELSASAVGFGPLSYQWYKGTPGVALTDSSRISGSTTDSLTLNPYEAGDAGDYFVRVTNSEGAVVDSAVVSVQSVGTPEILAQPLAQTLPSNRPLLLTVEARGAPTLSYAWTRDGAPVGGDAPYLLITAPTVADSGDYRVTVSNGLGSAQSAVAAISIVDAPGAHAADFASAAGANGTVQALGSGRIAVIGSFNSVRDQNDIFTGRSRFALYDSDGTLLSDSLDANNTLSALVELPDGSLLLGGFFTELGGAAVSRLAKLRPDLSVDSAFSARVGDIAVAGNFGAVEHIVPLPDGRIFIAGSFTAVSGLPGTASMAILHADGSVDTSFNSPIDGSLTINAVVVDAQGRFVVASNSQIGGQIQGLYRILADGSFDSTFNPVGIEPYSIYALDWAADGDLIAAGTIVRKVAADGTVDGSFGQALTLLGSNSSSRVESVAVQGNGRIVLAGSFTYLGGPAAGIARLLPDGSVDPLFDVNSGFDGAVESMALDVQGRIVVSGNFQNFAGTKVNNLAVLRGDPVALGFRTRPYDTALTAGQTLQLSSSATGTSAVTYQWARDGIDLVDGGRISGATTAQLNVSLFEAADTGTYTVTIQNAAGALQASAEVLLLAAPQITANPVGGRYFEGTPIVLRAAGLAAPPSTWQWYKDAIAIDGATDNVLRINAPTASDNGSYTARLSNGLGAADSLGAVLDIVVNPSNLAASFPADNGAGGNISAAIQTSDGGIVLGGSFSQAAVGGAYIARSKLARFAADGTLDADFNPAPNSNVNAIVEHNGGLLVGGFFTSIAGSSVPYLARFADDGTLDTAFNAKLGSGPNSTVNKLMIDGSGRIYAAGSFTTWNGQSANRIVRLLADGSRDPGFTFTTSGFPSINALGMQFGKLILGGFYLRGFNENVLRLNSDGSIDDTFASPTLDNQVQALAVMPNGKIVIGGNFTSVGGDSQYAGMARLLSNGGLDTFFAPGAVDSFASVLGLVPDAAGRVVAVGSFSSLGGVPAPYIARLLEDGSMDPLFVVGSGFSFQPTGAQAGANGRILVFGNSGLQYKGQPTYGLVVLNGGPAPAGGGESAFTSWAWQLPEGRRGPADRAYDDGVANLHRYLFGMPADGPSREGLPVQETATGAALGLDGAQAQKRFLVLNVNVRDDLDGVDWEVQSAADLDTLAAGTGAAAIAIDVLANGDGTSTHRFRSAAAIEDSNRIFMTVIAAETP